LVFIQLYFRSATEITNTVAKWCLTSLTWPTWLEVATKYSAIAEGMHDGLSVEILSTAAQLYEKIPFENRLATGE